MAKTSKSLFSQIIINGTFSVDCFFFISGYLVTHLLLKYLKQVDNKLNLTLFYLKRYLRMTPTMMTIIGFGATMLRYFGNGPEWSNSTVMFDRWCRTNWWVNSLYLHNFVNMDNMVSPHPVLVNSATNSPLLSFSVSQSLLVFCRGHAVLPHLPLPRYSP